MIETIGSSTAGALLYAVTLFGVLIVVPATITYLKGHYALFALGFLVIGTIWYIAAFRLARPGSSWARKFYGEEKMARARERYGEADT